jgi:crossover junction endodeoxyribonuclease RusA
VTASRRGPVYELDLPWTSPPLSLNHRNNWRAHARKAAALREAAHVLAKKHRLHIGGPYSHVEVTLHYTPRDRRVRDVENPTPTLKACCDGLVDAGVVIDDDPGHMTKHMPVIHDPSGLKARLWLEVVFPAIEEFA